MLRLIPGDLPKWGPEGAAQPHDELAALATAVKRKDPIAQRTFLHTIVPHLLRVVRRVVGPDHRDLEDITNEAAYTVMDRIGGFRGETTVLHFACRIAVLTAMNTRRRDAARKRAISGQACDPHTVPSEALSPEQQAIRSSLGPVVRDLLATLSEPLAEALVLHVVLGYTVAEVAACSNAPPETVRSRLRLAKQALRRRVTGDAPLADIPEDPT